MRTVDVLIVGAGATGLYLSNLLRTHHIGHLVVDAKPGPSMHSRSIGIHPASFPLMEEIGVMEAIRREAVSVRQGQAWSAGRRLGVLPLGEVLTLPQHRTEAILEAGAAPVEYGVRFLGYRQENAHLRVSTTDGDILCHTVLGCDGMHSTVREAMGLAGEVAAYPYDFFMADLDDTTPFGSDAAIFLHPDGMTESFPLGGGQRRWVVMRRGDESPDLGGLLKEIRSRTGHQPDPATHTMFSAFKAYRHIAPRLTDGQVFLVGDAAHVTSPIGGQGSHPALGRAAPLSGTGASPCRTRDRTGRIQHAFGWEILHARIEGGGGLDSLALPYPPLADAPVHHAGPMKKRLQKIA